MTSTVAGKDGIIRIAKIECKGKILTRAIDLLFPLELKAETGEKIKNKIEKNENENLVQKINLRPRKKINYAENSGSEVDNFSVLISDVTNNLNFCPFTYERSDLRGCRPTERFIGQKFSNETSSSTENKLKIVEEKSNENEKEIRNLYKVISKLKHELSTVKERNVELENTCKEIIKLKENFGNSLVETERLKNDFKRLIADNYANKNEINKRNKNGKKTGPLSGQINTMNLLTLVMTFLFLCLVGIVGSPCPKDQHKTLIHAQSCVSSGLAIMRMTKGMLCWEKIECGQKHIQENIVNINEKNLCGPRCVCPLWTQSCSFYNGPSTKNSTESDSKVKNLLESIKIDYCKENEKCGKYKTIESNQIQLYDNSLHLIKEMKIDEIQSISEEYECIGQGLITGSPKYCQIHECEEYGTKFCFYTGNEIAFLITDLGTVAVKAWGKVKIKVMEYAEKISSICKECKLMCNTERIEIISPDNIGRIEICVVNGRCALFPHPKEKEIIPLPLEILVSNYEVTAKFWKRGALTKETGIKCQAKNICELIKCNFCIILLKNPQCASKIAIILFGIIIYIFLSVLILITRIIIYGFKGAICIAQFKFRIIRWIYRKCKRNTNKKQKVNSPTPFRNSPRTERNPLKLIIVLLTIIYMTHQSEQITSITASNEKCIVNKNKERICLFEHVLEINFLPHEQEIQILLEDNVKRPQE